MKTNKTVRSRQRAAAVAAGYRLTGIALVLLLSRVTVHADPPELESWLYNSTGATGHNGIAADIQRLRYSTGYVYINATGIPAHNIGPWPGNPNDATNQNFVFKLPRAPQVNTGTPTTTPLGPIGVWRNGVVVFNAKDAFSYNNRNVWHRNAVVAEAPSFDSCLGHPPPNGAYHHHQNPVCVYNVDPTQHSPLVGFAYDGFPIYGGYGYSNPDGSGGVARIRSSYQLRSITTRTSLPDGTPLQPADYGPAVSATFPLGLYLEDFEYLNGLGDLDAFNGRFGVTPEYPCGTYAYFTTLAIDGSSAYPYAVGPQYYGVVVTENLTTGGHVQVTESVTEYTPPTPPGLLRDDSVVSFEPTTPAIASLLPLQAGSPPAGDDYLARVHDDDLDPERAIVADVTRPLVFYALTSGDVLRLVKASGCAEGTVEVHF